MHYTVPNMQASFSITETFSIFVSIYYPFIFIFRFVEMFCPMLTNVSALNTAHTWLCAIRTCTACSIKKQTAPFLKSFQLYAEAPVRCGQHGGLKATAVSDIGYSKISITNVLATMFEILRIHFSAQPQCPGDLHYMETGPAFPPTCTNPQPYPELTSTCQPPQGWSLIHAKILKNIYNIWKI